MEEYDLEKSINFINISANDVVIFEWKPPGSFTSFALDLNVIKENTTVDIFFHINKGNRKMAYIREGSALYTIGSEDTIQFQLLEAIVEAVIKEFKEIYDLDVILSYENVSANIFNGFKSSVDEILKKFKDLNTIKIIRVPCRVCNKNLGLIIKKNIIEEADSYPVPIVYNHKGHAILCYIDKNFEVRGVELVNITG